MCLKPSNFLVIYTIGFLTNTDARLLDSINIYWTKTVLRYGEKYRDRSARLCYS